MTYDEAWAAHLKRQNIVEQNEQTFRHGWNAALAAASALCFDKPIDPACPSFNDDFNSACYECQQDIQKLGVEVFT